MSLDTYDKIDIAARDLMGKFPNLETMSLDEWALEHNAKLPDWAKKSAQEILTALDEIGGKKMNSSAELLPTPTQLRICNTARDMVGYDWGRLGIRKSRGLTYTNVDWIYHVLSKAGLKPSDTPEGKCKLWDFSRWMESNGFEIVNDPYNQGVLVGDFPADKGLSGDIIVSRTYGAKGSIVKDDCSAYVNHGLRIELGSFRGDRDNYWCVHFRYIGRV